MLRKERALANKEKVTCGGIDCRTTSRKQAAAFFTFDGADVDPRVSDVVIEKMLSIGQKTWEPVTARAVAPSYYRGLPCRWIHKAEAGIQVGGEYNRSITTPR